MLRLNDIKPGTLFRLKGGMSTLCRLNESLLRSQFPIPTECRLYFDVIDFKIFCTSMNPEIDVIGNYDPAEMFI